MHTEKYDSITVQDIALRADINRVTFYSHYKDKDDLLNDLIVGMLGEMVEAMRTVAKKEKRLLAWNEPSSILLALFTFIAEHKNFFQLMFQHNERFHFYEKMFASLDDYFCHETIVQPTVGSGVTIQQDIYSHFITSAIMRVIELWISENMKYSPHHIVELMTDIFNKTPRKSMPL